METIHLINSSLMQGSGQNAVENVAVVYSGDLKTVERKSTEAVMMRLVIMKHAFKV